MYFRRFSGVGRLDLKTCESNYLLGDKVTVPLAQTIELAFTNRPAKRSQMLFLAGNTNKAHCSTAILAVLDALYAIPSGI